MEKIAELMIDCEPEEKAYYEKQYRANALAIKRYKPLANEQSPGVNE